ncbi:TSO2, partial [Symbiodinium necroappetens]
LHLLRFYENMDDRSWRADVLSLTLWGVLAATRSGSYILLFLRPEVSGRGICRLYALSTSFAACSVEMASQGYKAELALAAELERTEVFKQLEENDPLLKENPRRWPMPNVFNFASKYRELHGQVWEMYKKHEASFWTVAEIDLAQDNKDWVTMNEGEQHFVKQVLAFFAASDGIVVENLAAQFSTEVQIPE